jgi:hypothetical protein
MKRRKKPITIFTEAAMMIKTVQKLYLIEKKARKGNYSHEQRYLICQEKSISILRKSRPGWTVKF